MRSALPANVEEYLMSEVANKDSELSLYNCPLYATKESKVQKNCPYGRHQSDCLKYVRIDDL